MGLNSPNYTQTPNEIYDIWMRKLTGAEFKVLSKICRNTFGWRDKKVDRISLSQLTEFTGLSKQKVIDAVKKLEEYDLIKCSRRARKTTEYGLVVNKESSQASRQDEEELVKSVDKPSQVSRLELVNSVDIQKKDINSTKEKDLFNSLKDYLLTKYKEYHNTEFTDFPKEMKSIKSIIKKSKGDKSIIYNKLKIFEENIKNPTSAYWSEMAFLPSKINGMWDSLIPPRKIVNNEIDPTSEYEDLTKYKTKEA